MSVTFDRLRRISEKRALGESNRATGESDLPLDHQLTFSPQKDERWSFRDDSRLFINDADVGELVGENGNDIGLLCGISQGLSVYKDHVWSRGGKGLSKFNGVVTSLQGNILGRLSGIYDGITGGVRFEFSGDDFWLNNVNISSVLKLYRIKPTDKARRYLMGLRQKLGLILSGQQSSTRYDGIHARATLLFGEISAALEYLPADAPLCLGDGARCA